MKNYNQTHITTKQDWNAGSKRLEYAQNRTGHNKFNNKNELVEVKKLMLFAYPKNEKIKDKFFHLAIESDDCKSVQFVGKDVDVPKNLLWHNERNLINFASYDESGNPLVFSSNYVTAIAESDECESCVPECVMEYLANKIENCAMQMFRFHQVEKMEADIIALQKGKKINAEVSMEK